MHYTFIKEAFKLYKELDLDMPIENTILNQIISDNRNELFINLLDFTGGMKLAGINSSHIDENPWLFYKYIMQPKMKLTQLGLKLLLALEVSKRLLIVTDEDITNELIAYLLKEHNTSGINNFNCDDRFNAELNHSIKQIGFHSSEYFTKILLRFSDKVITLKQNPDTITPDYFSIGYNDYAKLLWLDSQKYNEIITKEFRNLPLFVLDFGDFISSICYTMYYKNHSYRKIMNDLRNDYENYIFIIK